MGQSSGVSTTKVWKGTGFHKLVPEAPGSSPGSHGNLDSLAGLLSLPKPQPPVAGSSLPEGRVPTPATLCVPPSHAGTGTLLQKGHSGSWGVSGAEFCVGLGLHFPSPDNSGSSPFGLPDVPISCCHLLSQGR